MDGIQYIVDERGEKTGVQIDLALHGDLWEDMYDTLLARARVDEPRESIDGVKERLRRAGKLSGDG